MANMPSTNNHRWQPREAIFTASARSAFRATAGHAHAFSAPVFAGNGPAGRVPADALPERTTLVNDNALPTPAAPAARPAQAAAASLGTSGDSRNAMTWVVLVSALLAGVSAATRVIRLR
jgi:hypothetical protein